MRVCASVINHALAALITTAALSHFRETFLSGRHSWPRDPWDILAAATRREGNPMILQHKLSSPSALLALLLWTPILLAQSPTSADLLLIHGHILTLDDKDSAVQAIAIRHGIIVKAGTD